jgi:Predicted Zn-dependent protease (DUF2268)
MQKSLQYLLLLGLVLALFSFQTEKPISIITEDIDHFWAAYDSLSFAKTTEDSVAIVDRIYLGQATDGLKAFHDGDSTNLALQYVETIRKYPKYWLSVRPMTQRAKTAKSAINRVFDTYEASIPKFRRTNVCFVIGFMNRGGTTDKDWIFIGTEMMAADSTVDKSDLSDWQKTCIGLDSGDLTQIVAHEAIHTQQISTLEPGYDSLLQCVIDEGVADFIPHLLLDLTINEKPFEYGYKNECALWQQLKADFTYNDTENWLYNGDRIKDKPADLGYFMGYRIAEAYYNKCTDKREALNTLLKSRDCEKILEVSKYTGNCKK